ncbi:MAG: STAS domain-containing protein [Bacteroidota bacterium]|nr:STAS domain-containing protein [Bacteroidota bacterium]
MKFSTKELNNVTVVKMEGSMLGGPEASELNSALHKLLDAKKKNIVVDLGGVSLMNSSGLGMIIGAVTTMRNAGGNLKIAAATEKVAQVFKMTKVSNVIELHDTVKSAVESFK